MIFLKKTKKKKKEKFKSKENFLDGKLKNTTILRQIIFTILFILCVSVMSKFCDSDKFNEAVDQANNCLKVSSDPCSCFHTQANAIDEAACMSDPLTTFFMKGCQSYGCSESACKPDEKED